LVKSLPFYFVSPVSSRHLAFRYVASMSGFKRFTPSLLFRSRRVLACTGHALLSEANGLYLVARLRHNYMRLSRVARCALRLVVPRYTSTF
jgi:hypothetical protein